MKTRILILFCFWASLAGTMPVAASVFQFGSSKFTAHLIPFTTFEVERKSILEKLPCNWVSTPTGPKRYESDFDFLCKGGPWATVSYMLTRSPRDPVGIQQSKLIWREWYPQAHPSGGEAYVAQPFLMHMIYRFIPVSLASEVEFAFWQEDDKEWMTDSLLIKYTYEYKQDHALRKIQVVGLKPRLNKNLGRPSLQPRPLYMRPNAPSYIGMEESYGREGAYPYQDSRRPEVSPYVPVTPPVMGFSRSGHGPAFMQQKSERSVDYQPKVAPTMDRREPIVPRMPVDNVPVSEMESNYTLNNVDGVMNSQTYTSSGRLVPPYQDLNTGKTGNLGYKSPLRSNPVGSTSGLPELEKSYLMEGGDVTLGNVFIPEPPSVFFPQRGMELKSDTLLKEADRVLNRGISSEPHNMNGSSLKSNLLNDYHKAETQTEKYKNRAEGKTLPLEHEQELTQ